MLLSAGVTDLDPPPRIRNLLARIFVTTVLLDIISILPHLLIVIGPLLFTFAL